MSAPGLSTGSKVAVGALVALDLLWLLVALWAIEALDQLTYADAYDAGWRQLLALLVAAAPIGIVVQSRGRRVALAWGIFLAGALLVFGVCVVGA